MSLPSFLAQHEFDEDLLGSDHRWESGSSIPPPPPPSHHTQHGAADTLTSGSTMPLETSQHDHNSSFVNDPSMTPPWSPFAFSSPQVPPPMALHLSSPLMAPLLAQSEPLYSPSFPRINEWQCSSSLTVVDDPRANLPIVPSHGLFAHDSPVAAPATSALDALVRQSPHLLSASANLSRNAMAASLAQASAPALAQASARAPAHRIVLDASVRGAKAINSMLIKQPNFGHSDLSLWKIYCDYCGTKVLCGGQSNFFNTPQNPNIAPEVLLKKRVETIRSHVKEHRKQMARTVQRHPTQHSCSTQPPAPATAHAPLASAPLSNPLNYALPAIRVTSLLPLLPVAQLGWLSSQTHTPVHGPNSSVPLAPDVAASSALSAVAAAVAATAAACVASHEHASDSHMEEDARENSQQTRKASRRKRFRTSSGARSSDASPHVTTEESSVSGGALLTQQLQQGEGRNRLHFSGDPDSTPFRTDVFESDHFRQATQRILREHGVGEHLLPKPQQVHRTADSSMSDSSDSSVDALSDAFDGVRVSEPVQLPLICRQTFLRFICTLTGYSAGLGQRAVDDLALYDGIHTSGLPVVLAALEQTSVSSDVHLAGLRYLAALTGPGCFHLPVASRSACLHKEELSGLLSQVVKTLHASVESSALRIALEIVANCMNDYACQEQFFSSNSADLLICAMRLHPQDAAIQFHACDALAQCESSQWIIGCDVSALLSALRLALGSTAKWSGTTPQTIVWSPDADRSFPERVVSVLYCMSHRALIHPKPATNQHSAGTTLDVMMATPAGSAAATQPGDFRTIQAVLHAGGIPDLICAIPFSRSAVIVLERGLHTHSKLVRAELIRANVLELLLHQLSANPWYHPARLLSSLLYALIQPALSDWHERFTAVSGIRCIVQAIAKCCRRPFGPILPNLLALCDQQGLVLNRHLQFLEQVLVHHPSRASEWLIEADGIECLVTHIVSCPAPERHPTWPSICTAATAILIQLTHNVPACQMRLISCIQCEDPEMSLTNSSLLARVGLTATRASSAASAASTASASSAKVHP